MPSATAQLGVSLAVVLLILWQDGDNQSNDGDRYISGAPQPTPFHRRFCSWPRWLLRPLSLVSLVALGACMGSWKGALLFMTLPGAWFLATHLTIVDAPCMLLALGSSLAFKDHPWLAVLMSLASGFMHERGPVFAALYAWHPLPLIGLLAVGWWRQPAERDKDRLVGRDSLLATIRAHKPYVDFLDWRVNVYALRAVLPLACFTGVSLQAWVTLAVAWFSRVVGTDACRYALWGAPLIVREVGADAPLWVVAVHCMFVRRMI